MKSNKKQPPLWANRILAWYCDPTLLEDLQGDLYERFELRCKQLGHRKASVLYYLDVLRFIKPYTIRKTKFNNPNSTIQMLGNYFKTSYRSLLKQKLNSFVNIVGLSLGICSFILISLYVNDEWKYDRYLTNYDRIYRLTLSYSSESSTEHSAWSDPIVSLSLADNYTGIKATTSLVNEEMSVSYNNQTFREDEFYFTDENYFRVFPYDFVAGSADGYEYQTVVLTETTASKYFGTSDPINQTLEINNEGYTVVGVLEDLPSQTDLKFDALISKQNIFSTVGWTFNYILFQDNYDVSRFESKLGQLFEETLASEFESYGAKNGRYHIESLPDVHFGTKKLYDTPKSSKLNLYLFSTVALLILITAAINYINISLAGATRRQAEVGIRKAIGARSGQLKTQFLLESFIICLISLITALGLTIYFLPFLNGLTGKQIYWEQLITPVNISLLIMLTLVLAIIAGSYPAMYLANAVPTKIFKGETRLLGKASIRRVLVVSQFTVSIILIISTSLIFRQLELIQTTDHGFTNERVLVIDAPDQKGIKSDLTALKEKLQQYPSVHSVSVVGYNSWPTSDRSIDAYEVISNGTRDVKPFREIRVDQDYFRLLGLTFLEGKGFNEKDIASNKGGVVINKAMVDYLGWKHPLEQSIGYENRTQHKVVGVVDDFHYNSFKQKIEPMLIFPDQWQPTKLLVRLNRSSSNISETKNSLFDQIQLLENEWESFIPDHAFEFEFLSDYVQRQYQSDKILKKVFSYFAITAITIACLGLFGLISLYTSQKLKEISIRKVFGAQITQLYLTLSKEFILLISLAFIISIPCTIFGIKLWLADFVYKVPLSIDLFVYSGLFVLVVALITISFHIISAIRHSPALILKAE